MCVCVCVYIVAALVYFSFALMMVIGWLPKRWQIYFEIMASDKDRTRNDVLPSHLGLYRMNMYIHMCVGFLLPLPPLLPLSPLGAGQQDHRSGRAAQ